MNWPGAGNRIELVVGDTDVGALLTEAVEMFPLGSGTTGVLPPEMESGSSFV
jgi:mannose/fructose/N-acetylgalactosamine-specific phosphotransferase system component IIC